MSGDLVREGGCGCGAVRYRLVGEPIFVNNCHCRQCQQQTGSTSVVNAFFESERLTVEGELSEHTVKAGSGGPHIICRCAQCGCAIMSYYPRLGRLGAGVRVGTFDDPASVTPDGAIFTAEKMPWVTLPEGIPHFDAYYDPGELLPPERFERLKTLASKARAAQG